MFRLTVAVLSLLAASCANVPSDYKIDASKPVGLVVGTITYDSGVGEYGLVAQPGAGGAAVVFRVGDSMWSPFTRMHDTDLNTRGGTFAVEVPAGDYRIVGWQVRQGYKTSRSAKPIDIEFKVGQGRATYLGNLHFSEHWEVSLRERGARDLPVLQRRFRTLGSSPVAFAIADGTNAEKLGGEYASNYRVPIILPLPIR